MSDRDSRRDGVAAGPVAARAGVSAATPCRYCLGCGYALQPDASPTCPECGRSFEPSNPRTTSASPRGHRLRDTLHRTTVLLAWALGGLGLAATAWGFVGGHPLLTLVFGLPLLPFAVVLVALIALPSNPISPRTRLVGLATAALLISVVLPLPSGHLWPLRASIRLHHAGLTRIADEAATLDDATLQGRTARTGLLHIQRIARWNGNLGLQLSGDAGGGVFLVRTPPDWTPSRCTLWVNTNWEVDLGDGWWLVDQD